MTDLPYWQLLGLPRAQPGADAVIPYVQDNADPALRAPRAMTLTQLQAAVGNGATGAFTLAEIAAEAAAAADYSAAVRRKRVTLHQPDAGLVLWISYGQSLSMGVQSWPAFTTTAPADCYMVGDAVHAANQTATWSQIGALALNPLSAKVLLGGQIQTPAQVSAFPRETGGYGETPLESFATTLRPAWLRARGKISDDTNRWVFCSLGDGGQPITNLMSPSDNWSRVVSCVQQVKALAQTLGRTFAIGGMIWVQGEGDYGLAGSTQAEYVTRLSTLIADFRALALAETGRSGTVPVFLSQTGGQYARDEEELKIGRAQAEVARTVAGVYLGWSNQVGPDRSPIAGHHLTANGTRWMGCQLGKVAARVLIEREGWEAPGPIVWKARSTTLLGQFHVPVPPLRLAAPVLGNTLQTFGASCGLYVADAQGAVAVTDVRIFEGRVLLATLARALVGTAKVWIGRLDGTQGGVNLADSDETPLPLTHVYDAASGQWPEESIASLNGLAYPASNWCVADVRTVTAV